MADKGINKHMHKNYTLLKSTDTGIIQISQILLRSGCKNYTIHQNIVEIQFLMAAIFCIYL